MEIVRTKSGWVGAIMDNGAVYAQNIEILSERLPIWFLVDELDKSRRVGLEFPKGAVLNSDVDEKWEDSIYMALTAQLFKDWGEK